jgi:nitronate monooxygenase
MMARYRFTDLLPRPIAVAPMAGGPSTTDLVIAATRAGALGFLAAGYKTPAAMAAEIAAVRAATAEPFGVNVFVPGTGCADPAALERYLASPRAAGPLGEGTWDDDGFDGKVAALLADPPAVVSQFIRDHPGAPAAYPEINNATRPLRAAAAARDDPEQMSLWAGQGWRSATEQPAAEIIERLTP